MNDRPCFLAKAIVVKARTDDGLLSVTDLKIGESCIVDIYARQNIRGVVMSAGQPALAVADVIQCADDGGWLPRECLRLSL